MKLGIVNTYSGPFAAVGEQLDRGIRLYMQQHEKDLPPGVKLDIIRRDDTGPNPEVAKRMAQELITRDHVHGMKDDVTQFGQAPAQQPAGSGVLTIRATREKVKLLYRQMNPQTNIPEDDASGTKP